MVVLMRVTISALLVLSGALKTTATPQAASSNSADFSSSQLESIDPSSAFSSSQPFTSAGDGVDHASAITLSAQSSDPTGIDDISTASPIALSSDQAVLSAGDGIGRASAITLTQTTPTPSDGIDHAPPTTFHPTSTSPPDGIDHASVVTLTSTTSPTTTTRTATSTPAGVHDYDGPTSVCEYHGGHLVSNNSNSGAQPHHHCRGQYREYKALLPLVLPRDFPVGGG